MNSYTFSYAYINTKAADVENIQGMITVRFTSPKQLSYFQRQHQVHLIKKKYSRGFHYNCRVFFIKLHGSIWVVIILLSICLN